MARYPSSGVSYTIGPGGISPAVKMLVIANVAVFLLNLLLDSVLTPRLGLSPPAVFTGLALWQPVTYMFLHAGLGHLLFNMLALWMFGTDLERTWGTRFFTKYYFVTGVGAAVAGLLLSLWVDNIYYAITIGASGAIYGLLLAYALYFPHRTIYLIIFPLPARVFVIIAGVLAFVYSADGAGGVSHISHLGGLVAGYLYLKGLRMRPLDEIKYRYLRWKMGRARSKFDVYSGGRSSDDDWKHEWKKHIH
jgi:membrane associated rhomboid family serine protease